MKTSIKLGALAFTLALAAHAHAGPVTTLVQADNAIEITIPARQFLKVFTFVKSTTGGRGVIQLTGIDGHSIPPAGAVVARSTIAYADAKPTSGEALPAPPIVIAGPAVIQVLNGTALEPVTLTYCLLPSTANRSPGPPFDAAAAGFHRAAADVDQLDFPCAYHPILFIAAGRCAPVTFRLKPSCFLCCSRSSLSPCASASPAPSVVRGRTLLPRKRRPRRAAWTTRQPSAERVSRF